MVCELFVFVFDEVVLLFVNILIIGDFIVLFDFLFIGE